MGVGRPDVVASDGDAVDDDDAVDDAIARSEGEKRTKDSVEVQRRLARRLLDAQRRWVGPASSSGRDGGAARVERGDEFGDAQL